MHLSKSVALLLAVTALTSVPAHKVYAKATSYTTDKVILQSTDLLSDLAPLTFHGTEQVIWDDTVIPLNTLTKDNRKYVPLRELSEKLGYHVTFATDTKTITIQQGNGDTAPSPMTLRVGDPQVTLGEQTYLSDAVPFILYETSTTYVPLRLISESFGAKVDASGDYLLITTQSQGLKAVQDALYDDLLLSEWVSTYTTLFNDFKTIGNAAEEHANSTEVLHKQGGYSSLWNIHLTILDLKESFNPSYLRTPTLDVSQLKNLILDALDCIDTYCLETLDTSNWSKFLVDSYLNDLSVLESLLMQIEQTYGTLSQSLNIIH